MVCVCCGCVSYVFVRACVRVVRLPNESTLVELAQATLSRSTQPANAARASHILNEPKAHTKMVTGCRSGCGSWKYSKTRNSASSDRSTHAPKRTHADTRKCTQRFCHMLIRRIERSSIHPPKKKLPHATLTDPHSPDTAQN